MQFYDASQYRFLNRVILLSLFIVGGLILFFYMGTDVEVCWSYARYGKECVLCGCTRDFVAILLGNFPTHNVASIYIFIGLTVELLYRMFGSFIRLPFWVMLVDLVYHVVILSIAFVSNIVNLASNYLLA